MNINKKELFQKVEDLVDQLVLLVEEYKLTDKAEYNDYLNVLVKLTLAAGQAPIEKITHATALISMLQLRMQGNEKMDQLANSGMKLSIGDGKMEISYGKPPEVSSIAKETIIDLTQMDSKMAELNQLCSDVNSENSSEFKMNSKNKPLKDFRAGPVEPSSTDMDLEMAMEIVAGLASQDMDLEVANAIVTDLAGQGLDLNVLKSKEDESEQLVLVASGKQSEMTNEVIEQLCTSPAPIIIVGGTATVSEYQHKTLIKSGKIVIYINVIDGELRFYQECGLLLGKINNLCQDPTLQ